MLDALLSCDCVCVPNTKGNGTLRGLGVKMGEVSICPLEESRGFSSAWKNLAIDFLVFKYG